MDVLLQDGGNNQKCDSVPEEVCRDIEVPQCHDMPEEQCHTLQVGEGVPAPRGSSVPLYARGTVPYSSDKRMCARTFRFLSVTICQRNSAILFR